MTDLRPYRLTLLLHPETSSTERRAVEDLVTAWVEKHHGTIHSVAVDEKRKLAYGVAHHRVVPHLHAAFTAPPDTVHELGEHLRLQQRILRTRLWSGTLPTGKRLKDLPPRKPETAGAPEKTGRTVKTKAPLTKLEEKITEILKEEVL